MLLFVVSLVRVVGALLVETALRTKLSNVLLSLNLSWNLSRQTSLRLINSSSWSCQFKSLNGDRIANQCLINCLVTTTNIHMTSDKPDNWDILLFLTISMLKRSDYDGRCHDTIHITLQSERKKHHWRHTVYHGEASAVKNIARILNKKCHIRLPWSRCLETSKSMISHWTRPDWRVSYIFYLRYLSIITHWGDNHA